MHDNIHRERPQIMQAVLTVKEKIYLTPHYIRVLLEGDDISVFKAARIGDNNKLLIPDGNKPITLPDMEHGRGESRQTMRTYTTRNIDLAKGLMTIDFVAHGENGPASKWAIHAKSGDSLGVLMKVKNKQLFQPADWYLLAGDHTALPVISVILEQLPADAKGKAFIEVLTPEDVLDLKKPDGIELQWIFNAELGKVRTLPNAVINIPFPNGNKFIYAAAEYGSADEIQDYLRNNSALERNEWQTYSYWKYGQSEDSSKDERRNSMHQG